MVEVRLVKMLLKITPKKKKKTNPYCLCFHPTQAPCRAGGFLRLSDVELGEGIFKDHRDSLLVISQPQRSCPLG